MTTFDDVGIITNTSAELLLNARHAISEDAFVEMVVWCLPQRASSSRHAFKYRFALVANGRCVLRYDNELGKGDHKHLGDKQVPHSFTSLQAMLDDFWSDVDNWRS